MCNDGTRISRGWGGANLLFGIVLAENCVKMKKIGREGGGRDTLDPPMICLWQKEHFVNVIKFINTFRPNISL